MELQEAIPHFSETISAALLKFVNDDVLKDSRYLLFRTEKFTKITLAYCTHCNQEYRTKEQFKHNERCNCEKCGTICYAKQAFRKRGKMFDSAYIEFAERSLANPEAITVSGYYVYRDYREEYRNVETTFIRLAIYVFEPGAAHMWKREKWGNTTQFKNFKKTKTVSSLGRTHMRNERSYLDRKSFTRAVKKTPFKYIQWEQYHNDRLLEYFALACKYPIVEVLTKIGLRDVIWQYLNKNWYGGVPYILKWRAKSLDKIIGLPKSDWKQIKKLPRRLNGNELHALQQLREQGETLPFLKLFEIYEGLGGLNSIINFKKTTGASLQKIWNYVCRQYEKDDEHYGSIHQVKTTWSDYLLECRRTNVDLTDSVNLFPTNLWHMHDLQNQRKKAIADLKLNLKIRKRVKVLSKLQFEYGGLLIKPIENAQELADESNKLVHCVSSYGDRYANGQTDLMVIRKTDAPGEPYYTVELSAAKKEIKQVRGHKNKPATKEIELFMDKFKQILNGGVANERRKNAI